MTLMLCFAENTIVYIINSQRSGHEEMSHLLRKNWQSA